MACGTDIGGDLQRARILLRSLDHLQQRVIGSVFPYDESFTTALANNTNHVEDLPAVIGHVGHFVDVDAGVEETEGIAVWGRVL
ncbi:hypothetical protein SDC9_187770 [bioreactor metagenome]|uniref:Uncharacterized protein n=1 Tax=bioreactor metagenome TaxID=1076179 RepID=A0A645HVN5_9ZZZZ